MQFTVIKQEQKARVGNLITASGSINTPIFMPVGTSGTVKAVHQRELEQIIEAEIILANTYHLFLRPKLDILQQSGGLHKFMGWKKPILTDSGGYQVFSLSDIRKIKEEGVYFRSHIDGSKHLFTPENVVDAQRKIGSDIMMAFDECTPYPCEYSYALDSMNRTHRWLQRGLSQFNQTKSLYDFEQNFFPIVQGSVFEDLRKMSAEYVITQQTNGYAIGGLSVGEPHQAMYEMTELVCDILPTNKPRYLMGVGTPQNILEAIAVGVDMFDCVLPTRNARNGMLFTTNGIINIKNKKFANDFSAIDDGLDVAYLKNYSKAYLRHLVVSNEILACQIATIQNLCFYLWLVRKARQQILCNNFYKWKADIISTIMRRL